VFRQIVGVPLTYFCVSCRCLAMPLNALWCSDGSNEGEQVEKNHDKIVQTNLGTGRIVRAIFLEKCPTSAAGQRERCPAVCEEIPTSVTFPVCSHFPWDLDLHLIHGSLSLHESAAETASRSVQPFLHSSSTWLIHTDHASSRRRGLKVREREIYLPQT